MASLLKSVLVDLSGTIHIENTIIPGSIEAIKRLRESGLDLRFITNTTKESKRTLLNRLNTLGFDIQADEVFTSLSAARQLIERRHLRPMLLLETDAQQDFEGIDCSRPNSVVMGLAPNCFNYETMNKAFRLVLDGHPLIAIHKGRYYKQGGGIALGPGPFVAAIEFSTNTTAEVVGKPEPSFFHQVLENMGCDAQSAIMVGDDVRDDIGGAQAIEIKGILVKTGKYREGDEKELSKPPFAVCSDFASAVRHILSLL